MIEHEVAGVHETATDDRGAPATRVATPTGHKIECVECGARGWPVEWPPGRWNWLKAHRHHVRCSCGKVTTVQGFAAHAAGMKRDGR